MASAGLEGTVGATYEGAVDYNGKWTGPGKLSYSNGVAYHGTFIDGQFHGEGELHFPNGAVYRSVWNHGREVHGSSSYEWEDGLPYNIYDDWDFLSSTTGDLGKFDRRYWAEHESGDPSPLLRPQPGVDYPRNKAHVQTDTSVPVVSQLSREDIWRAIQGVTSLRPKVAPVQEKAPSPGGGKAKAKAPAPAPAAKPAAAPAPAKPAATPAKPAIATSPRPAGGSSMAQVFITPM